MKFQELAFLVSCEGIEYLATAITQNFAACFMLVMAQQKLLEQEFADKRFVYIHRVLIDFAPSGRHELLIRSRDDNQSNSYRCCIERRVAELSRCSMTSREYILDPDLPARLSRPG